MSDQQFLGYRVVDPVTRQPIELGDAPPKPKGTVQRSVRTLTWAILGVCLALWGIIGFLFWVPLLLRSSLRFTLALIQSMLQGTRPHEAGRILYETVDFYRRGFLVAIEAVFGKMPEPDQAHGPMPAGRFVIEIGWAIVFWYAVLLLIGVVETTPADLWRAVVEYPWGERLGQLLDRATGPAAAVPADSAGVVDSAAAVPPVGAAR